jgi:hypothetical protein
MKKDISVKKKKHIMRLLIVAAAIGAGAFCRSLSGVPPGAGKLSGTEFRTGVSSPAEDFSSFSDDISVSTVPTELSGGAGEETSALQDELPAGKNRKKTTPKDLKPDIEALKKGIRPIEGAPGDMSEYLDDAERKRKIRIRKSLGDIQKKVKEWEKSIFEPTW